MIQALTPGQRDLPFATPRRNFPTDTNGTNQDLALRRVCQRRHHTAELDGNLHVPRGVISNANANTDGNSHSDSNSQRLRIHRQLRQLRRQQLRTHRQLHLRPQRQLRIHRLLRQLRQRQLRIHRQLRQLRQQQLRIHRQLRQPELLAPRRGLLRHRDRDRHHRLVRRREG